MMTNVCPGLLLKIESWLKKMDLNGSKVFQLPVVVLDQWGNNISATHISLTYLLFFACMFALFVLAWLIFVCFYYLYLTDTCCLRRTILRSEIKKERNDGWWRFRSCELVCFSLNIERPKVMLPNVFYYCLFTTDYLSIYSIFLQMRLWADFFQVNSIYTLQYLTCY